MNDELRSRDFNVLIDHYLLTGMMHAEDYEGLTDRQKDVVQVIKRAYKRINNGRHIEEAAK